jgi:predicted ArsR family transcriptional regulator
MIEIKTGTLEERVIKTLQKQYPITVKELSEKLHVTEHAIKKVLVQLHAQSVLSLEPLPGKTFIRLLRFDFKFIGRKNQYKFVKRKKGDNMSSDDTSDENTSFMYH